MDDLVVEVDTGKLRGVTETSVLNRQFVAFKGIPYAEPPVGKLRFTDPQPPQNWTGVRDATKFGNNCAHIDPITRTTVGDDDCLYLNVYTTSIRPQIPKAVMVWIHGGAFVLGSGDDTLYGGDYLVDKDIILVTINYRVGILGFLDLEDEVATGNQGLKDQVAALKWVQRNIDKFGGDPRNVTIFGESAGGASVHYLTISPLAQGLFHKAVLQSGVAINPWASVPGSPKQFARRLAALLGKETNDSVELLEFLRSVEAAELIEAQAKIPSKLDKLYFLNPFGPTVDLKSKNPFLPVPLEEAIKAGIKVPCIIGYMNDEGLLVAGGVAVHNQNPEDTGPSLNDKQLKHINENYKTELLHPTAVKQFAKKNLSLEDVKKIYFGDEEISMKMIKNFIDLQGDAQFVCGIHDILEVQALTSQFPTYLYKLDIDVGLSLIKLFLNINLPGTCHSDELPFLFYARMMEKFGMELPEPSAIHKLLIQRFTTLWANFAKTGNPTPSTSEFLPIIWPPIHNPKEYNCLRIHEDLTIIKDFNIYDRLSKKLKNKL